ncbi:MAG: hypothetical protein K2L45_02830 [Muribaculaceae bacterium]|nr:hypothetical protein [Muribaculaceae bacterium]
MNRKTLYGVFSMLIALLFAYGCADDRYLFGHDEPGEGEAMLTAEISFKNYTPALTRTPGDALNGIENLFVFIYKENGSLVEIKEYQKSELDSVPNYNPPSDGEGMDVNNNGELTLPTFKTTLKNIKIPYGRYQIYAAANIRGDYATALRDPEGVAKTVDGLKSFKVKWDSTNIGNDDQMFGYFLELSGSEQAPSASKGFGPSVITINQPNVRIGAWLRRLASKVTVAYDASGLNQGVWVYIKNVTVHDIAAECYLGKKNEPSESELLNRRTGPSNQPEATYTPSVDNTRITYPGNPTENIYDKSQSGIELYNGLVEPDGTPILKGSVHSAADKDALFFYENMQGDYSTESNKADYDKRQHGSGKDQVGENVRDDDGKGNDYKDRVKNGTYVEVEAYYISINQENPSQGPIKYRFMLGKDITYNYDVERNYHFKLTLGFKGWANQPDWHIDYDIPDPNLDVPPVYRVSYLYQSKSSLPVKVSKNCTSLRVDIIENNWAPSNPDDYSYPSNPVSSTPGEYQFQWNKAAFDNYYKKEETVNTNNGTLTYNAGYPWLGFLALNMPKADDVAELPVTIPEKTPANPETGQPANYWSFKEGVSAQNALKAFYDEHRGQGSQGYSIFQGADLDIGGEDVHMSDCPLNAWSVVEVDDGTDKKNKIVMVPLWTRAKTMIENSGFSGNNPYEYFVRKAILKVTATFDETAPVRELTEYVTVLQEPRIVNPKAIWRKSGSTAGPFHVVLMTTLNSNQKSNYTPLKSDGEWTASVEMGSGNFTLSKSNTTKGEEKDGKIYGKTGSEVDFNINFNGNGYAVINVLYHSNNCVHKILVRQGYDDPMLLGGKYWSNYTLQSATAIAGETNVYEAEETESPFYLGSLYRRGRITRGILEINNYRTNMGMGPFQNPTNRQFYLTDGQQLSWVGLGCEGNNTDPEPMGTFKIRGENWKVPELADFNELKSKCEFALGIIYGEATETAKDFETATGFSIENSDNTNYGVRGVIAYDAKEKTAAQVLFSLGKDGYGRRKNADDTNVKRGMLIYSDVDVLLPGDTPNASGGGNVFRPVPYNLKIAPGAIFWLNNRVENGFLGDADPKPTMSWDINYFNYDFNSFDNSGDSNCRDACVIKLVKE